MTTAEAIDIVLSRLEASAELSPEVEEAMGVLSRVTRPPFIHPGTFPIVTFKVTLPNGVETPFSIDPEGAARASALVAFLADHSIATTLEG